MKDLEGKLRLKARNELLKWLHKPHENAELSDYEQGYLEAAKMLRPLVKYMDWMRVQGCVVDPASACPTCEAEQILGQLIEELEK